MGEPASPHLEDARLAAWSDGALPPHAVDGIARHLHECADCAARARALEEDAGFAHARISRAIPPEIGDRRAAIRRRSSAPARGGLAAGIVLLVLGAVGAAALLPGVRTAILGTADAPEPSAAEGDAPVGTLVPQLSVLAPARVRVVLPRLADSLRLRVTLSGEPWLEVRSGAGERLDRVELAEESLVVAPGGARALWITVPAAVALDVTVEGAPVLKTKGGGAAGWSDSTLWLGPVAAGGAR